MSLKRAVFSLLPLLLTVLFFCNTKEQSTAPTSSIEIPSVINICATYDTTSGFVRLKWHPAEYANIKDYIIFKDVEPTGSIIPTAYRSTTDTTFIDTVFNINKIPLDTQAITYVYRVAIRNKLMMTGNTFNADTITAIPYKSVLPFIDSVKVMFDTASGTANVTWKSIPLIDSNYSYYVLRNCAAYNKVMTDSTTPLFSKIDTIEFLKQATFADSLYRKKLSFQDTLFYKIAYTISVFRKDWKLFGKNCTSAPFSISPYKILVPQLTKGIIIFDTLQGVAKLSWDSIPASSGITGFKIIRNITNTSKSINKTDTLPLWKSNQFLDTIFPKIIPFDTLGEIHLSYSIAGFHTVWGIYGNATTISAGAVSSHSFKPQISVSDNQTVDISSDVFLNGKIISSKFPIVKKEWKIGDSSWVVVDSGKIRFRTNSDLSCDTILCIFRVTDSAGNIVMAPVTITKAPLVVTLPPVPWTRQATGTCYSGNINFVAKTTASNTTEYYAAGEVEPKWGSEPATKWGVWRTTDFKKYDLLTSDLKNSGQIVQFRNQLYIFNAMSKSYTSSDGIACTEISPVFKQGSIKFCSNIIPYHNKMFAITSATGNGINIALNISTDGITWDTVVQQMPQESVRFFFTMGNTLALNTNLNTYTSTDEGASWQIYNLQGAIGQSFTEPITNIAFNDSVTVISLGLLNSDPPSPFYTTPFVAIFNHGIWKIIPHIQFNPGGLPYFYYPPLYHAFEWRGGYSMSVVGNYLMTAGISWEYRSQCEIRMFKLY